MRKVAIIGVIAIILAVGFGYVVRARLRGAEMGTDITYALDAAGAARVEMREKVYFTTPEIERNYDGVLARQSGTPLDVRSQQARVRQAVNKLVKATGRTDMAVENFGGRLEKANGYGARVLTFNWRNFARRDQDTWRVDFRGAGQISLNERSTLVLLLPAGAAIAELSVAPDERSGERLVWRGPREMQWPYIVYRLP